MDLSEKQEEALEQAQKHGGRLVRWKQGGYWTYAEAIPFVEDASDLEWCCTTNTIFALVRRGYMVMDDWKHCSLNTEMNTTG
ncbi:hypothetical protein J23TS9_53040 [Paenibacillus sp. J23TS9]|uniref:hypothetical protein n=1 Tax=Paenibacillus sp. J23TS9 TaxID=2807193 RepID=UPI001B159AE7|nr:hypothetical protein [Paenibacillus sp. J23TS9]GIP30174.1 hypothetical protein J23TS9_53040 [Paenibacillus sp. J23TS9]